jgi:hypothetical protein
MNRNEIIFEVTVNRDVTAEHLRSESQQETV